MTYQIDLHIPSHISVSGGASELVGTVARANGIRRALVVSDPILTGLGLLEEPLRRLKAEAVQTIVYDQVAPDPTVDHVTEAGELIRSHRVDGLVAIGGGSSIDTAKAAAMMARNPGSIADYAGYQRFAAAGLPVVALPTTAGTGSEVTRVTVITEPSGHRKLMILDDKLLCRAALVDFRLTITCPPEITAAVGIDSLTHAIEAYVSKRANAVTDQWCLQAASLIFANLRVAYTEPEHELARAALSLGSTLAGLAFSNSSVALVHGMSRPIGAHFHVRHGLSNAILLPAVTRYSVPGAVSRYAEFARTLGVGSGSDSDARVAEGLIAALEKLNGDLDIPRLRDLGIERRQFDDAIEDMVAAALESGSPAFNPRVPTSDEVAALYESVY